MRREVKLSPERTAACADVTKELSALVHEGICDVLTHEVSEAFKNGGQIVSINSTVEEASVEEINASLIDVSLETHKLPSVILLLAYIIKTHTKPSQIQKLVEGVMLTLGVDGKIIAADEIVDDISKSFDI